MLKRFNSNGHLAGSCWIRKPSFLLYKQTDFLLSFQILEENIGYLVGDCLIAAAFLSYAGPFLSNYRDELVEKTWLAQVRDKTVTVVLIT